MSKNKLEATFLQSNASILFWYSLSFLLNTFGNISSLTNYNIDENFIDKHNYRHCMTWFLALVKLNQAWNIMYYQASK